MLSPAARNGISMSSRVILAAAAMSAVTESAWTANAAMPVMTRPSTM
jgi:hypothetical protein